MGVKVREHPKGSGVWFIFINHQGKRKAKKIGKDKRLAIEAAKQIEAELRLGDLNIGRLSSKYPTFREYADRWISLPNDRKELTNINYRRVLRKHIYAAFGHMRLDQIKRKDIKLFFDGLLRKGLKPSGFCAIKTTIKSVLQHAVESDIIETNYMADISVGSKVVYKVNPLTEAEAALLLDVVKQHKDGLYHPPLLCALRTGMRIGEIQALEWEDVDFEARLISVTKSQFRGTVTSTKNKKIRKVDMSLQLAETLRRLKLERKKLALREGKAFQVLYSLMKKRGCSRRKPLEAV